MTWLDGYGVEEYSKKNEQLPVSLQNVRESFWK